MSKPSMIPLTGVVLQEVLRILHCMGPKEFRECWPEQSDYLWEKYRLKDYNVFNFICYLDEGNAQKLVEYAYKEMNPEIKAWTPEGYAAFMKHMDDWFERQKTGGEK
jgi:hypothetical protein